jgi:hypothetical protein
MQSFRVFFVFCAQEPCVFLDFSLFSTTFMVMMRAGVPFFYYFMNSPMTSKAWDGPRYIKSSMQHIATLCHRKTSVFHKRFEAHGLEPFVVETTTPKTGDKLEKGREQL